MARYKPRHLRPRINKDRILYGLGLSAVYFLFIGFILIYLANG